SASANVPSAARAPARTAPAPSRMLPTALSTTSAPTTMSPPLAAQLPTPPFMAARGPSAFPTVAPVPAPTDPSTTSAEAAVQAARIPLSGPSTTLQPVARSRSVQCPTEIPRTAVRLAGAEDAMGARSIARLARVVEGTYVSAMPNPDPQSPPTTVLVVDDEDG